MLLQCLRLVDDKAHYYPGAGTFIVKMIADKSTGEFLGIQVLGKGAVDKMVDIAVSSLSLKATFISSGSGLCLCAAILYCYSSL